MINLSIDSKNLSRRLQSMVKAIEDTREPLRETADFLEETKERQFQVEGAHVTTKWKALAPSTIKQRIRKGYGAGPILQNTGALRKSFSTKKLTKEELRYGSSGVHYFPYHQLGTSKMVARPMLAIPTKTVTAIVNIFRKYISKSMK